MKPEVATPAEYVQILLAGGAEPLPYGRCRAVRYVFELTPPSGYEAKNLLQRYPSLKENSFHRCAVPSLGEGGLLNACEYHGFCIEFKIAQTHKVLISFRRSKMKLEILPRLPREGAVAGGD